VASSAAVTLSPAYRLVLAQRILSIISRDVYANITDFQWVVSVLVDVAFVSRVDVGSTIKYMLLDIVGRVRSVRPFAVQTLEKVLDHEVPDVLEAAIWICGEYAE
jgi:AP-3 complex subunit delta-1